MAGIRSTCSLPWKHWSGCLRVATRPKPHPWYLGALAGGLALFLAATLILRTSGLSPEVVLFYAFSGLAVAGAAMLVTQQNPARAALSFTLVVLSSCGLFLLLGAPFLMAAV